MGSLCSVPGHVGDVITGQFSNQKRCRPPPRGRAMPPYTPTPRWCVPRRLVDEPFTTRSQCLQHSLRSIAAIDGMFSLSCIRLVSQTGNPRRAMASSQPAAYSRDSFPGRVDPSIRSACSKPFERTSSESITRRGRPRKRTPRPDNVVKLRR